MCLMSCRMIWTWILMCLFAEGSNGCSNSTDCTHLVCDKSDAPHCVHGQCYCTRNEGVCFNDHDCRNGYCSYAVCDLSSSRCFCPGHHPHHTYRCSKNANCAHTDCGHENEHNTRLCHDGTCGCFEPFHARPCTYNHGHTHEQCPEKLCADPYGSTCYHKKCVCYRHHVSGHWSSFGNYGSCSVSCGGGTHTKKRTCTNPAPAYGGLQCVGSSTVTAACNTQHCPVDGSWSKWGAWGRCSVTCGEGTRERLRTCSNPVPSYGGAKCTGSNHQTHHCDPGICPIDGSWSTWSHWGTCSITCGGGTVERVRSCSHPAPSHGGANCVGTNKQTNHCNIGHCPIDGSWSEWVVWESCSLTCGGGTQKRLRTCSNPAPSYGGANCVGSFDEIERCNTNACPIASPGVSCPVCDARLACVWGKTCPENDVCMVLSYPHYNFTIHCSVKQDCIFVKDIATIGEVFCCEDRRCLSNSLGVSVWSSWESWGNCSVACGNGTRERQRTCIKPFDDPGSPECDGSHKETQQCNTDPCPIVTCPVCDISMHCVWDRVCPDNLTCMIMSYPNSTTVSCSVREDCNMFKADSTTAVTYCCDDRQCINEALNV